MIIKFDVDSILKNDVIANALTGMGSYTYSLKKLDLNLNNCATVHVKTFLKIFLS